VVESTESKKGTPRFLEACKRQGIESKELEILSLEEYKTILPELDTGLLQILWENDKEVRKGKQRLIDEVINVIII